MKKLIHNLTFLIFLVIMISKVNAQNNVNQFGISILNYGAKPASDWKNAKDNSAAIQKAIDENPGRLIFIPSGIYLLNKEIVIRQGVRLVGENKYTTILQPVKTDGIVINSGGVLLENFFLYGQGKTAITINNVRNTTISNILIQNAEYGIKLVNAWNTKISNLDIDINPRQNPKVLKGIILVGQSVNNFISNSHITAADIGIDILKSEKRSEGLMLSNVLIYSAKTGIRSEGILSLNVSNCIIDLCEEYAIQTRNTASLLVSNCWIYSKGKNKTQAIKLSQTWDSHFLANSIRCENGSSAIAMDEHSNNNIISNSTIELINANNEIISMDKTTSANLIKDNNFKMPKNGNATIINKGLKNKIIDNTDSIIK